MAHSEAYPNGSQIHKFFSGETEKIAERFGELSENAFLKGATMVNQKMVLDNEPCPCGSDIRFDLCCKKKVQPI